MDPWMDGWMEGGSWSRNGLRIGRQVGLAGSFDDDGRRGENAVGDGFHGRGGRQILLRRSFGLGRRQVLEGRAVDRVGRGHDRLRFGLLFGHDTDGGVQSVRVLGGGAVDVEPPVAHEDLLVENGAVGAQERRLEAAVAHVEDLRRRSAERVSERGSRQQSSAGLGITWQRPSSSA